MSSNNYKTFSNYIKSYEDPAALPFENSVDNLSYEDSLMQQTNQEQNLNFDEINTIQNPDPISPEEEEELHQKAYYYPKKFENADSSKQLEILNNPSSIEEKPEIPKEEKINQLIKKEAKNTKEAQAKNFSTEKKPIRIDYLIKKLKTYCFSKHSRKKINKLIKQCKFPDELKITKIYLADHKAFTADSNYKRNRSFLSMKLRDIYTMSSDNKKSKNEEIFNKIDACTNALNPQAYNELIDYLNKTVEEVIIEFYGTDEFKIFKKENEQADRDFFQEKKFSFMENYGFLKLILNQY